MATYAVGDVQGCLEPLQRLLESVRFDPAADRLWLVGDLVNRGPASLATLRFVRGLGDAAVAVLGNHDLHLLARVWRGGAPRRKDTLAEVLEAPDLHELVGWLRALPLVHHDRRLGWTMVHAGIPHIWSIEEALARSREVETWLRGEAVDRFFAEMYGDDPPGWRPELDAIARARVIVNYFTRMRFIDAAGDLDLKTKEGPAAARPGFFPWFHRRHPADAGARLVFGHWAALDGAVAVPGIHALDTGCVWGGRLSMLRLEDERRSCADCR